MVSSSEPTNSTLVASPPFLPTNGRWPLPAGADLRPHEFHAILGGSEALSLQGPLPPG